MYISYTNPRDEHDDSGWVFEKKGLSLYTLSGFFLFLLTYRVYLRLAHNLPLQGALVLRLLLVVVGQILYCSKHTVYLQYNTCTHATQIPRPICSRVLGPVFILYYIRVYNIIIIIYVCYLPVGIVRELVYFFRLTLASPEECIYMCFIPTYLYIIYKYILFITYVRKSVYAYIT